MKTEFRPMPKSAGATDDWTRIAIFWVSVDSKAKFDHALGHRLRESAKMALSLVGNNAPLALDALDRPAKTPGSSRPRSAPTLCRNSARFAPAFPAGAIAFGGCSTSIMSATTQFL
ncbi:hypothetical protein [Rhodoblastus sp.]|uniref:hypothetical protein n=1 Tax=Rhodoblastus sp. TaxID=1962975 RepID=UPI003F9C9D08